MSVAAGAASVHDAHDRIIAAQQNVAVVNEEDNRPALPRRSNGFLVVDGDRFLAQVAAGHDQRVERLLAASSKMMQRRVGKKDAQVAIAWGNFARESRLEVFCGSKHDRALRRLQRLSSASLTSQNSRRLRESAP